MKIGLTLEERFTLIRILPEKGDFTLMGHVCTLRDALLPGDEETAKHGIPQPDDTTRWDLTFFRKTGTEIEVGKVMTGSIMAELERLSSKGELQPQHVSLYRKFVVADKPAEDETKGTTC